MGVIKSVNKGAATREWTRAQRFLTHYSDSHERHGDSQEFSVDEMMSKGVNKGYHFSTSSFKKGRS